MTMREQALFARLSCGFWWGSAGLAVELFSGQCHLDALPCPTECLLEQLATTPGPTGFRGLPAVSKPEFILTKLCGAVDGFNA